MEDFKAVWASELHIDNHRCLPGIWMTCFTEFGASASLRHRQVESPSAVVSVLGPAGVHREAAWLWFPDPSVVPQLLPILNSTRQQASQSHLPHQWQRHHALRETGRRLFRSGETWRMAGPVWKSGRKISDTSHDERVRIVNIIHGVSSCAVAECGCEVPEDRPVGTGWRSRWLHKGS